MQVLRKDQWKQVVTTWDTIASEIEEAFGLSPQVLPSQLSVAPVETTTSNLVPGLLKPNSIVINSNVEMHEKLLPTTITKLCFQSALPSDLLCTECIDDLSFEFARRKIGDETLRSLWESLWSEHSPPRQISTVIEYHPCVAYIWLHSVSGNNGLDTFVQELTHRAKNQIPLTFDEYLRYFSMRIRRFENTLDSTELKIVRYVVENSDLQFYQLAKLVGITQEWVSRKLSQLQNRMILRKFDWVPFSRIGIRMHQLLMSKGTSEKDPFSLIKDCPFLYSYKKVVSGEWNALATLCIPDNRQSMQHLNNAMKLIENSGVTLGVHQINSSGVSHCFDYYSAKDRQWNIPWELLTIHLERIKSDELGSSMPRIDTPELKPESQLDDLDIGILDCISKGVSSVSKIRNQLKVGQHRVADKLRKLRESELVVKMWEAHNIGLSEHVVVFVDIKDIAESIAAWSLRLPRSIIAFSPDDELILIVDLPRGGSYGLASAIGEIDTKTSIGILSPSTYGSWRFPASLWDSNYQKWKCPERDMQKWIASLK